MFMPRSDALEDRGHTLAAADAHGFQTVSHVTATHFMEQGGHDAQTGCANRVA
ncbi:hypothetical protein D3C86_1937250 [compost metagenome]